MQDQSIEAVFKKEEHSIPDLAPKPKLDGIAVGDQYEMGGQMFYIKAVNQGTVVMRPLTLPGGVSARSIIEKLVLKR